MVKEATREVFAFVGTYNLGKRSEGIYIYRLDPASGALEPVGTAAGVDNPSFLALHPRLPYLYAVNEVNESRGQSSGAVSAFAIDLRRGQLAFLNQQSTHGPGPCHLTLDHTGRYVLVANYSGGSVCVLSVRDDGQLDPATDFVQHQGHSIHPQRQQGPHAHSVMVDPANRYAFVPDLGLDKIMIYRLDLTSGKLTPNDEPWAQVAPGSGPRHFTFHPSGRYAYCINELASTVTAFAYDGSRGRLQEIGTVSALPAGFEGRSHCADIHILSSGKFLYGSNRGHDSIVVFAVDQGTGGLTYIAHEPTLGASPRNFAIDPSGRFLLAANQRSDTIVAFSIDQDSGKLAPTGQVAPVPTPVCVKMLLLPRGA